MIFIFMKQRILTLNLWKVCNIFTYRIEQPFLKLFQLINDEERKISPYC
jgi:hypothetical protein